MHIASNVGPPPLPHQSRDPLSRGPSQASAPGFVAPQRGPSPWTPCAPSWRSRRSGPRTAPCSPWNKGSLVARCRGRTPCPGLAGPPKKDAARDGRENPGVGPKKPRVRPAASFISSSAHALFRKHLLQRSPEPSNCSHPSPAESFPFATNLGANKRTLLSGTGTRGLNSTFFLRIPRCGQRGRAPEGSAPAGQGPGQELHSSVPPSAPCTRPQDGSLRFAWARPH